MAHRAKVYQRRDTGKWFVQLLWEGKPYIRSHYDDRFKSMPVRELADRLAGSINHDIDQKGPHFDPRDYFLSDRELQFDHAARKWLKGKEYAPSTRRVMAFSLTLACDYFKAVNIKKIRKAHIRAFSATLTEGPSTKRRILNNLKACLNELCDDWHIMRIPFPSVTVPHKDALWLSRDQQERILAEIPARHKPIFLLQQAYGCRPAEACALQWEDVDWNGDGIEFKRTLSDGQLRESSKTGYTRRLPLSPEIKETLKPLRGLAGYVFRRPQTRDHYTPTRIGEIWTLARKKSGLKTRATPYQGLRHSKASQLHLAGYDIESIRQFMGHRSIKTTEIYTHVDVGKFRRMVG